MDPQVAAVVEHYGMRPLPVEGTLFVGTYRWAADTIDGGPVGTAMIGLYAHDPPSRLPFHRLPADEVWHFYGGDPIRLVLLRPDGSSDDVWLGPDPGAGHVVQYVIPAGTWQAGELCESGSYGLFGCTMAPYSPAPVSRAGPRTSCWHPIPGATPTSTGSPCPPTPTRRCRRVSPRRRPRVHRAWPIRIRGASVDISVWDAPDHALLAGVAWQSHGGGRLRPPLPARRCSGWRSRSSATTAGRRKWPRMRSCAWHNAASFDPRRGSVTTWLLAITRNVAIDRLRREAVRPADPADPATMSIADPADGPEGAALVQSDVRRVTARSAPFRKPNVAVSCWRRWVDVRPSMISATEHIPLGTAKTRIRDGLIRVRGLLAAEEPSRD